MVRVCYCAVLCAFFLVACIYMAIGVVTDIGCIGLLLCCAPLGFALIWGARLAEAIIRVRGGSR